MRPRHVLAALLAGTLVAVFAVPGRHGSRHAASVPTKAQAAADLARLPVAFEPNVGQAGKGTRFVARAPGYDLLVGTTGARMVLRRGAVSFRTLGSNPHAAVSGSAPLPGRVNYFIGHLRAATGTFRGVNVSHVYPGVDLRYAGGRGRIEYTFTLAPGADPAAVRLGVTGAKSLRLDPAGDLVVRTPAGTVVQHAPLAYQTISGRRRAVHAAFSLRGHSVGFTVAGYDRSAPLVIDPVLTYSTYLAGDNGDDQAYGVALNSAGDIVVSGDTRSATFPGTESGTAGGSNDAFVIELDPTGTSIVYSTYIGGNGDDEATAVALDSSGNAYLTGFTDSENYPLQASTASTNDNNSLIGNNFDVFVTELSADGSSLVYSTIVGGIGSDEGEAIAVGSDGAAYVTGFTNSTTSFPTTSGAFRRTATKWSAFVTKLDPAGANPEKIAYSTFLGGSIGNWQVESNRQAMSEGLAIGVDSSGDAYVGGLTLATNFPTTTGAYRTSMGNADTSGFVSKLSPDGSSLLYSTYLGGNTFSDQAQVDGLVLHGADVFVAGATSASDFPTTSRGVQRTYGGGGSDAFVTELAPAASTASQLVYSTLLGGNDFDGAEGLAVDAHGNVFVTGRTFSSDFPTAHAFSSSGNVFVAKIEPALSGTSGLAWSGELGGGGGDTGLGIATNSSGDVFVVGQTPSTSFPTVNALVAAPTGSSIMGFLAEIADTSGSHVQSVSPASGTAGTPVTIDGAGFTGVTSVKFNGVTAPGFVVNSSTQITVDVPALATDGNVTVTTSGGTSNGVHFDVTPVIDSFSPTHGVAGQVVDIVGKSLVSPSALTMNGGAKIPVSTVTAGTHLRFTLPATATSGVIAVTTKNGVADTSADTPTTFTVDPKITSFTPLAAAGGANVKILGSGLADALFVTFWTDGGLIGANMVSDTPTAIVVQVPDEAIVGPIDVTTASPASPAESTASFKPLPKITSIAPADGVAGETVTINGTNLLDATGVKFGTTTAPVNSETATAIQTTVPAAPFSSGKVTVVTPGGTGVSTQTFQITKVTGFSPLTAPAGATITITGQGLGSATSVDFPDTAGDTNVTATATSLKVVVPDDAGTGQLVVHTPNIAGAGITTTQTFKAAPTISSLSAVDGAPTDEITISGKNLDGATAVKFGTVSVSPDSVSTSSVTAKVPGAPFSTGKVSVVTPNGTAVSTQTYEITKVTGITPISAAEGTTITITGQGLGSTTSVDFPATAGDTTGLTATATSVKIPVPLEAGYGPLVVHTPNIGGGGIATTQSFKPLPSIAFVLGTTPFVANETVTVLGANFEPTLAPPTVKLGTETLPIIGTPNQISFQVAIPQDAVTGNLVVTTPEGSASTKLAIAPTISGGPTPSSGAVGTHVSLTGLTFTGTTKVAFTGGATAPFTLTGALGSTQTLSFTVPTGAESGPITVTNAGGSNTSTDFTVDPVITSFSPLSGPVGGTLTVKGTGLFGATSVTFGGGVTATPTSVTATSLQVVVPQGVSAGTLVVSTSSAGDSPASSASFTPTESLESFSPAGGPAGKVVTISGVGFTNVTDVLFGGTSVGPGGFEVDSATTILATVPAGASDGVITVVRSTAPTSLTSANTFGVLSVSSLSATSVHAGDTLTIHGTHLGNTTKVTFPPGIDATPTSVASGAVDVVVPGGVSNGALTVTTSDLGTVTTPELTILPPSITSVTVSNTPGVATVQILGAGFVNVSGVYVGFDVTSDVTMENDGEIDVELPATWGGGAVFVTTDEGTSSSGGQIYEHSAGQGFMYLSTVINSVPDAWTEGDAEQAAAASGYTSPSVIQCSGEDAVSATQGSNVGVWVYGAGSLQGDVGLGGCPTDAGITWN